MMYIYHIILCISRQVLIFLEKLRKLRPILVIQLKIERMAAMSCMTGAQTRCLRNAPSVLSFAAVGGRFEGEGPLRDYFDELSEDHFFGEKTWEKGESAMQRRALSHALEKAALRERDLDLIFAGDLLNQCTGSSFALRGSRIPFYGVYGACSTMGESLSLAAIMIDGGAAERAAALTS